MRSRCANGGRPPGIHPGDTSKETTFYFPWPSACLLRFEPGALNEQQLRASACALRQRLSQQTVQTPKPFVPATTSTRRRNWCIVTRSAETCFLRPPWRRTTWIVMTICLGRIRACNGSAIAPLVPAPDSAPSSPSMFCVSYLAPTCKKESLAVAHATGVFGTPVREQPRISD
jgi:hypothetical protein